MLLNAFSNETLKLNGSDGHHSSLLPSHFAERILTAVYLKHLQPKHIGSYLYIVIS